MKSGLPILVKKSSAGILSLTVSDTLVIKNIKNSLMDSIVIDSIKIDSEPNTSNQASYYILGMGHKGPNSVQAALHLEFNNTDSQGNSFYRMNGMGDKCIGNPCSKCKLVGLIGDQGCHCEGSGTRDNPGFCNHSTGRLFKWDAKLKKE